jgi:ubiquinone/menaquinone biosynthesis C-methylase UbiE
MIPNSSPLLVCADCQGPLDQQETHFACRSCAARYPSWLGTISLVHNSDRDLEPMPRLLLEAYSRSSFDDLLKLRTPVFSTTDPKLVARYQAYRQNMMERGRAFYEMARASAETRDANIGASCAIALGCGVGASMVRMSRDFAHVIGVDPSLPDLVLARKACDELGITNVTLAHCYGERMPVPSGSVDLIIAENVLEHVPDLGSVLAEVGRVLKPGAAFVGDCANRFNILRPEPHVQLWGVGLLPRKWQAPYVMWRRNFKNYDRSVHLKSYRQLLSALRKKLGPESTIEFPSAVAFGFSKRIDDVLNLIKRVPPLKAMLLWIFPVFVAVGRRSRG